MKKYILYVGEMELPDKNAAAHRVLANSKVIKESTPYEVVLVGLNSSLENNSQYNIEDTFYNLNEFGVYEYPYPKTATQWFKYISQINYIKEVVNILGLEKIYTIIAYNYPAFALERLRTYGKRNNIRIISDASEWYGKSKRSFPSNLVKDFDTFLRMRIINRRCHNLICASKYLEDYYNNKGCNTINIPSLVDTTSKKFDGEISINNNNFKIYSYVGSPGKSREKDRLDWIINSFYKLKEQGYIFKLIFAGIDEESLLRYYPELQDKVEALNDSIEFKGRVAHHLALQVIQNSDFTLFAREKNRVTTAGFPTKLAESYACRTPVVTTPSSNIKDYLENGKTGFISEDCDEDSFYNSLLESMKTNNEETSIMKRYIAESNPMSLNKFYDKCNKYIENL